MPSAMPPNPRAASPDFDEHEFDDAIEEFMKDLPIEKDGANNTTSAPADPAKNIDEEIKIKKKRKPVPKLDENRLLSQDGIPRLRKITKSRLRFKGKGHEFSDISRLMNMYQLWLDDLYPRAKFRDALSMVEKVGHSKRMKVMRKAFLDETKPFRKDADEEEPVDLEMSGALPADGQKEGANGIGSEDDDAIFMEAERRLPSQNSSNNQHEVHDGPDEDELDALLAAAAPTRTTTQTQTSRVHRGPFEEDSDEDELDALLAAESAVQPLMARSTNMQSEKEAESRAKALGDDFADEEEAMADMDMW